MAVRPVVALVAAPPRAEEMIGLVRRYRSALRRCRIVTSEDSAAGLAEVLTRPVDAVGSQPQTFDAIARGVAAGRVDAVICLRDPAELDALDPTLRALRICDLFDVLTATNVPTANVVLEFIADATRYLVRSRHPSVFDGGFPWDPDGRTPFPRAR